jgi:hypothetical protein
LREVPVEGEGRPDAQSIHHREAGGVGEGEVLVVVSVDYLASDKLVLWLDTNDGKKSGSHIGVDAGQESIGSSAIEASKVESMTFCDYEVRCRHAPAFRHQPFLYRYGIGVAAFTVVAQSQVSGGINKSRLPKGKKTHSS